MLKEPQKEDTLKHAEIYDTRNDIHMKIQRIETMEDTELKWTIGLSKENNKNIHNGIQYSNSEVEKITNRMENIQVKIYDLEENKKNNMILYGISNEAHEKKILAINKLKDLFKANIRIRGKLEIIK